MINILAFLIGLAVFVVALVALIASKLDVFVAGIDLGLGVAVILLTYPSVVNRSQ